MQPSKLNNPEVNLSYTGAVSLYAFRVQVPLEDKKEYDGIPVLKVSKMKYLRPWLFKR